MELEFTALVRESKNLEINLEFLRETFKLKIKSKIFS